MRRRTFLKTTCLAGVGLSLFHIGKAGVAPNDKIRHACFGAAGHAGRDMNVIGRHPHIEIVAVAEVDERRFDSVRERFPDARIYTDWRELLEKEGDNLDSVNISTPDHMHAAMAVAAMRLGLHVFVQKPMGLTIHETRRLTEIARECGVITQMGIQLSSSIHERMVGEILRSGEIGKIKEVHLFSDKTWGDTEPVPDSVDPVPPELDWELWCGVGPLVPYRDNYYHPRNWRRRQAFGTGTLGDMGCHIFGPMFQALGLRHPISITSKGEPPANPHNWAIDQEYTFVFPGNEYTANDTLTATWYDGARRPPAAIADQVGTDLPDQGNIFIGAKGAMLAPHNSTPMLYPREQYEEFRYPRLDPIRHHASFIDAIRGEEAQVMAPFDYAGPLTEAVLLGTVATHFPGETLKWDGDALQFTNQREANAYLRRSYRKGWEVEGLS